MAFPHSYMSYVHELQLFKSEIDTARQGGIISPVVARELIGKLPKQINLNALKLLDLSNISPDATKFMWAVKDRLTFHYIMSETQLPSRPAAFASSGLAFMDQDFAAALPPSTPQIEVVKDPNYAPEEREWLIEERQELVHERRHTTDPIKIAYLQGEINILSVCIRRASQYARQKMRAVIGPKAADYVETAVDSAVDIVSSAGWKAAVALSGLKSMTLDEESAGSEAKSEPFVIKFEIKEETE